MNSVPLSPLGCANASHGVSQPNLKTKTAIRPGSSQKFTNENRFAIFILARRAGRSAADIVWWPSFRDGRDHRGSAAGSNAAFSCRQLVESRHQRMAGGSEFGELYQLHQ